MTGNVQAKGEGDGEPLIVNHIYDSAIVPPPILAADFNFLYLYEFLVNRGFFGGLPHEDPNLHIKNFLLVCALHRQKNVSDDAFRLRLFPFSLKGKARTWLDDLPARSIHNWDELLEAFLDEFFPRGVIVELRCRVSTFKQKPRERLHEAWVRYKKCIRLCPQHRCTDESLLQRFYYTLNPENQILADNMAKGAILNLTFPEASKILDQVAKQAHAWDNKWRDVSYESSNFTISQDRDETIAQLSTQMTLLTKLIAEMMAQKVHVVESSSGKLQEEHNHVQDQEEDANYVSSYQGGPNEQRTNYQGGQDHDQWRLLQQWNSNQGWNNQQNNQGWSANSQGNRGAGSSQAYNASRDPMYQQGNQSPPYHNQGQQFSLSKDNYEQAKEATDFLQSGSSKDEPIGKNFQEKRMQFHAFLNFDGASKGNPGLAGAGAVLRAVDGSVVYRLREGLGFATNNVAEYRGVILGLKYALEKGFKHIQVQGDSKLLCMQIQGIWKTTNQNMVELSKTVEELKDQFVFPYQPCRKKLNTEADTLANLAVYLENGETQVEST